LLIGDFDLTQKPGFIASAWYRTAWSWQGITPGGTEPNESREGPQGTPGSVQRRKTTRHRTPGSLQVVAMSAGFCAGLWGPMRVWEGSVPGAGRSGFGHARPTCDHTFLNHKAWHRTPVTLRSCGTEPSDLGGRVSEMAQNPGVLAWRSKDCRVLCTIPWEPCTEPTPRFNSSQRTEGSVRTETVRCGFGGVLYHSAVAMSFGAAVSPAIICFSTI
jgi:hypothetical protein